MVVKLAEFSLDIDRTPEEVWRFMFDLKNVPQWDPGVVEAKKTSEGPLEMVGATIQTLGEGGSDRGVARVADFEMYRRLVLTLDRTKGPIRQARLTYTFLPRGNRTELTRTVEADIAGLWKLLGPIIGPRIQRAVDADSQQEATKIKACFPART